MFWQNDRRRAIRTTTTSQVHPTDQILCYMVTSESSARLAMAERAGRQSSLPGRKTGHTQHAKCEGCMKAFLSFSQGHLQSLEDSHGPQEVFLGSISLLLFLPFCSGQDCQCTPTCSRLGLWPCVSNSILENISSALGFHLHLIGVEVFQILQHEAATAQEKAFSG